MHCEVLPNKKVFLGCSIRANDEEPLGMKVVMIKSDSPADKAKLKVKDIILEIDGKPVKSINDYNAAVGMNDGKKTLRVYRKEEDICLEVEVDFIYSE